jgi:DNA-binding FrmR family transcriptional regulator
MQKDTGTAEENGSPGGAPEKLVPEPCCSHKIKHREPEEFNALIRRLSRIEGQIRGIRGMVEKDAYCTDILIQVSAAQAALNAFARELLGSHIRTCVVQDVQAGRLEVIDDLLNTIQKLMK